MMFLKHFRFYSLLMAFILMMPLLAKASDDFQYWSQYLVTVIDTEKVDLKLFGEGRFKNGGREVNLYLLSARVSYDVIDHVTFGTNYTFMNVRSFIASVDSEEFRFQHRAELEVNPYYDLTDWLKFYNRNRVEFRWIEGSGSYNTRSRHMLQLTVPIKNKGALVGVYSNSEFIYNFAEHTYDENRTIPIGLTWKLNEKASLKTFYMIQTKKGNDDWSANEILGTQFSFKF